MRHSLKPLLITAAFLPAVASAQDQAPRPVFSEPYTVADARAAYEAIDERWDQTQIEQQARLSEHEGDFTTFVRSDPILQDVTWAYDSCTDMVSLIPPPGDGWGISSEASNVKTPIGEDRAEVIYVRFDPALQSDDEAFFQTEEYITINVSRSPESVQLFEMMYPQEALRASLFEPGPYNYPLMMQANSTVLGDISVGVSANRAEDAEEMLTRIIGCAIKSGLIAEVVDPATLDPVP